MDNKKIAAILFILAIVGYIKHYNSRTDNSDLFDNYYKNDTTINKKETDSTNSYLEARKSAAKSSTLGFVDSIEYYAGFSEANASGGIGIDGYDKTLPVSAIAGEKIICSYDGITWKDRSKLAVGSTTCSEFFSETDGVVSKSKVKKPSQATIIIDANGKVQNGTIMKYNGFECAYNGNYISYCKQ